MMKKLNLWRRTSMNIHSVKEQQKDSNTLEKTWASRHRRYSEAQSWAQKNSWHPSIVQIAEVKNRDNIWKALRSTWCLLKASPSE